MTRALNSIPLLYVLMLLPGWLPLWDLIQGDWYYPQMMSETGVLSIYYLIVTLSVTPVLLLINRIGHGAKFGIWLLRRRKHFGLACFIFASAHLLHYIRFIDHLPAVWFEAFRIEFAVGWVALLILTILALTSNRASIRRLGRSWKPLHRLVYLAAAFSLLHWFLFDFPTERILFWTVILVLIKSSHMVLRWQSTKSRRRQTAKLGSPT